MKLLFAFSMMVCYSFAQNNRTPNTLTPAEQKEGYILLFDGKSLGAFDVRPGLEKVWRVADGVIKNDSTASGATLLTKEDFANYVLKAEFRAHPEINSGLMLRQARASGAAGYELQIRDKKGDFPSGSYETASIVNVGKAPPEAKILPGQWNTFEVTMNGDHMVVVYNGKKVVDGHDSKLKSGAIGLQSAHAADPPGAGIEFRNLKVKRLP